MPASGAEVVPTSRRAVAYPAVMAASWVALTAQRQRGDIAFRKPDCGTILFDGITDTIELAGKLLAEIIACTHEPQGTCRCGNRAAYTRQELAAFEVIYRCADMFTGSPYPVAVIEGLTMPPRQFAALGHEDQERCRVGALAS